MKFLPAVLAATMLASAACAQVAPENSLSFTTMNSTPYDWDCQYAEDGALLSLPFHLVNPVNPAFDLGETRPVTRVGGFSCRVIGGDGLAVVAWEAPVPATVWWNAEGDVLVLYDEPLPVQGLDFPNVLATCDIHAGDPVSFEPWPEIRARCTNWSNTGITVEPSPASVVPGSVAFLDADDPRDPWVAGNLRSTQYDLEVEIHAGGVPVFDTDWSAVKARYRWSGAVR